MRVDATRLIQAARIAAYHLAASGVCVAGVAFLVLHVWYPYPYSEISGGHGLFLLLISVDAVCGPLMTFVLYSSKKTFCERSIDLTLVAVVQIAALYYGINTAAQARPLALVYEVDRFRVVSRSEIYEPELSALPPWAAPWSFDSVHVMGLKMSGTQEDLIKSVDLSLAGIEPSQRPSRWEAYALSMRQVSRHSRPISSLAVHQIDQRMALEHAVRRTGKKADKLRYLPIKSRFTDGWIVLLDIETALPVGFAEVKDL